MAISLILFSIFSLFSFSVSSSDTIIINSVETLSDSHHLSMALTLQLVSQTLLSQLSTATVFAPSDFAFIHSGQPSLHQLQYHISPLRFSIQTLKPLPYATTIPTLLLNHSLTITSSPSDAHLSINKVKINETALYKDDRFLIIYGVDEFFNSSFQISPNSAPVIEHGDPILSEPSDYYTPASYMLRSRGYTRMATFLDMQLAGFIDGTKLTIIAPIDDEIEDYVKNNFTDYALVFRGHVVPDRLRWRDLVSLAEGTMLQTFSEGFRIEITRSGDVVEVNGVPVIFPDMYCSESLVVHGLGHPLLSGPKQQNIGDSFSELNGDG